MKKMKLMLLFVVLLILLIGVVNATELQDNSTSSTDNGATKVVKKTSTISQVDSTTQNDNIQTATKNTKKSVNEDTTIKKDINALNKAISSDINGQEVMTHSNENNVLGAASFEILQRYIDEAPEGSEISLNNNYSLADGGNTLKISKNITINGNNHTLNGSNKKGIFSIVADGKSVTLKNMTVEYAKVSENGAVILNNYASTTLTIMDCEFRDSYANNYGGAVYTAGDLFIHHSYIHHNQAKIAGGAIYSKGKVTVEYSDFYRNNAEGHPTQKCLGGAISSEDECIVYSTKFTDNHADNYGGAIYGGEKLSVINSNFDSNIAYQHGGAIYSTKISFINNTKFKKNSAKGSGHHGGAIKSLDKCNIYSCDFDNNNAEFGGAISADASLIITGKSKFRNHKGILRGGAIYAYKDMYINWDVSQSKDPLCEFSSNTVEKIGAAVYSLGPIYAKYVRFQDNLGDDHDSGNRYGGAAIYCEGVINVSQSEFLRNKITITYDGGSAPTPGSMPYGWLSDPTEGGAIKALGNCYIDTCLFRGNSAFLGGAIYAKKDLIITGSVFSGNTGTFSGPTEHNPNGGAIYSLGNLFINNSHFISNKALIDGGAIYSKGNATIYSSQFESNEVDRSDAFIPSIHKCYGGAIRSEDLLTLYNCTFLFNHAEYGGAIYADKDVKIDNCTFHDNRGEYGGAVYTDIITQVSKSVFSSNSANSDCGGAFYINSKSNPKFNSCLFEENWSSKDGGAIYLDSSSTNLQLSDCKFGVNAAKEYGGAVYSPGKITLDNCVFNACHAKYGGAVYASTMDNIFKSTFTKNNATTEDGGAIYINNNCDPIVDSCIFDSNTCPGGLGGSIYLDSKYSYLTLNNCTFTNSSAKQGGAVYAHQINTVSKSIFIGNRATSGDGGAILIKNDHPTKTGHGEFIGCDFKENTCTNRGGGIYMASVTSVLKVSYSTFTNNTAGQGGAIYANKVSGISDCAFLENKAKGLEKSDGGAVYINRNCKAETISCRYEGNTAENRGGAIYTDSLESDMRLKVSYCTFVHNHADQKNYKGSSHYYGPGHSIFNSGYYDFVKLCWFGLNNSNFKGQIVEYHRGRNDEDYNVSDYLKIAMKINDTNPYAGNPYKVTVYFVGTKGGLQLDVHKLYHSTGTFYGDGEYSNIKADVNDMTADVVLNAGANTLYAKLDDQVVSLSVNAITKDPSEVQILSCEGLKFPRSAKVKYSINHYSQNATYTITDSTGKVVKQAKLNSPSRDLYIDNLWPGTYTITIFNPETEKYLSSSANATFTSLKADMTFGLEVFDETYPGTVECIVYPGMDGEYECNLTVTGTSSIVYSEIVTVKNFDGDHFNIGVLYPGIYEATIYYSGSATYNPFSTSTRFKVNTDGTLFEIGIVPSEVNYGQTAEVIHILPDAATGDITYQLSNGTKLATLPVDQNLTLPKLDVGSYVIIAQYSGNMEYESANESAKFTVNQASNMAYVTASNVTYGKDTLIQVTADVDGTYQLDINGTIHNVTVNNGVGNKTILLDAGTYYANITFNDKNYNTNSKNTTFTVNKAINNIIVTANNVTYGKDTLIQVTADVDGTYQLDVSGELYNIIVSEGKANKTLTLNAGTYYANITFNDKNYNTNSKNTTFIVNKAPNNLDVKVNNVTYGKETVIEISANVDGEYIVNINDSIYEVTVKNGKANKTLNLDAGNYYAYVTFTDDNYNTVAKNMTFTVSKANITLIIMSFDEIYPEEVEVSVYASLDGKYKLRVANITTDITVKYHVASYVVGTLNPGVYEAVVSFDGDNNYNPSLNKTIITIYTGGVLFEIEANPNNISYGQTANVTHTISEDALGTIEYFLSDGTFLGELPVNKNLTLPVLDVGDYVIIANYTGDFFHNATYETATLTVNPLPNHVTISVNNVVYGEDTLIQIIADVDGIYQLDVNGNVYDINIINGAGNKTLKLDAGKYYANVTFNNKNYNTNTTNVTFSVHKAEIDLVVVVFDEVYPEDVECIVYASADGEYNLTITGHSTTVNVKDNIAYYNAGVLDAGTYEAVVSFDGDENHNNAFNTTTFHVYASGTSFELEVIPNEISYGQSAKVTHTISEGATGTIKYYLSNGTYLGGLPVNENLTLPVLDAGSYVIIGNYTGDNDFISAVDTTFITVNPISNNVIVSVSNVTYGEETLIQISADIDGTYQMDVNGEINEITVTDGKANKTLKLKAGNYYVNITFDNNNYKTHSQNATFTVYKADTIITTSQQTNYIGENITLTAKVTDKDGNNMNSGRVIFKLNGVTLKDKRGKTIYAKVENGTATITYIIPSNYQAKSYKLTAVYEGNNNYLGIRNDSQLNLKQRQIKLTLNTSKDVKIMQQLQLHVTVTDEIDNNKLVNGYIIFKIDGKTLKDENNKTIEVRIVNNTADYNYTIGHEFTAKEHTITAVLVNNTYSRSQADDTFKITTTQITINLDKITTNTKTAQLRGTIMDTKQNTITGTDKLLVKINGITIRNEDNTTQYYNITNGQIDITLNITKLKTGEHTVEVVTQESNIHLSTRNKTTLTITEEVQKKTTTNTKTEITKKQTENMIPSKEAVPSKKFDNHFETATNNYRFSNEAEIKNSQITRELTNLTYNKRKVEEDYTIKI